MMHATMFSAICSTIVVISATSTCVAMQTDNQTIGTAQKAAIEASRKIIKEVKEKEDIPGVSVAVQHGQDLVWADGFGAADLAHDVAVTRDTKFRLGSVSKILTASLTAKLAADKKVDLDKSILEYDSQLPESYKGITLRHLLSHQGGIRHYDFAKDYNLKAPGGIIDLRLYRSTKDALQLFVDDPLIGEPGNQYQYSTFGYTLISWVLEKATETAFADLLHSELFAPLDLNDTTTDDFRQVIANRTSFYERQNGSVVQAIPVNAAYKFAGGGLLSTAPDLAKFGAAHFQAGFFAKDTLDEIFTIKVPGQEKGTGIGLGWRIGKDESGRRIAHHAGSMPGCRAVLLIYPQQQFSIAILTNLATQPPIKIESLAQQIASQFLTSE